VKPVAREVSLVVRVLKQSPLTFAVILGAVTLAWSLSHATSSEADTADARFSGSAVHAGSEPTEAHTDDKHAVVPASQLTSQMKPLLLALRTVKNPTRRERIVSKLSDILTKSPDGLDLVQRELAVHQDEPSYVVGLTNAIALTHAPEAQEALYLTMITYSKNPDVLLATVRALALTPLPCARNVAHLLIIYANQSLRPDVRSAAIETAGTAGRHLRSGQARDKVAAGILEAFRAADTLPEKRALLTAMGNMGDASFRPVLSDVARSNSVLGPVALVALHH